MEAGGFTTHKLTLNYNSTYLRAHGAISIQQRTRKTR